MESYIPFLHHLKEIAQCYRRKLCNNSFATNGISDNHMETVHIKGTVYECNKCQFSTCAKCRLKRHANSVHNNIKTVKCHICERMFARQSCLDQHMSVHVNGRFPCIVCRRSFLREETLEEHKKVHRPCQICGLTFKLSRERDNHMKWHLQGYRFPNQRVIKRRKSGVKGVEDQNQCVRVSLQD